MAKIIIKNAPKDVNQLGKLIMEIATRDRDEPQPVKPEKTKKAKK